MSIENTVITYMTEHGMMYLSVFLETIDKN